jgi:hypothetical protein
MQIDFPDDPITLYVSVIEYEPEQTQRGDSQDDLCQIVHPVSDTGDTLWPRRQYSGAFSLAVVVEAAAYKGVAPQSGECPDQRGIPSDWVCPLHQYTSLVY